MYCAKCGVALGDTENACPLCGTAAHPDVARQEMPPLYPRERIPTVKVNRAGIQMILLTAFLLPMLICLQCDLPFTGSVTWSGFVVGALLTVYLIAVLPSWFRKPNPVIFVPTGFAAVTGYLFYINWVLDGNWFLSFALPVTGYICLVASAVVTLLRYVRKGALYVLGGAGCAMGVFMPLMGFLVNITFLGKVKFALWSLYPTTALVMIGLLLIFLAICRPARESMQRKFFV